MTALGGRMEQYSGLIEHLEFPYMPAWLTWARLHREAKAETEAKFGKGYCSPAWSEPKLSQSPAQKYLHEALVRNGTVASAR
jgi:hypothetical protein